MNLMRLNMPKPSRPISIGILLHRSATPTVALLMRDIFTTANKVLGELHYQVELISVKGGTLEYKDIAIVTKKAKTTYDILVVVPYDRLYSHEALEWKKEIQLIKKLYNKNTKIASSCLGSIILAESGILKDKEATTHWYAFEEVQKKFPDVKWNSKDMICNTGSIITAGGYLGAVDLILNLISDSSNKKIAHEIGRLLLAESSREKQSVYATSLISHNDETSPFYTLESWIEKNLNKDLTIPMMAEFSKMSLRSFQRQFTEVYDLSPKSFLQLKRIERAKDLLRDTRLSLDIVVEKIGLSDVSSFRKIFQRELGITPSEFRRRIK